MPGRLFGNAGVAGVLGKIWDVAVHFTIDLYVLDHLLAVGLESAVHVMQPDAGDAAGGRVVELGRKVLGQGVVLSFLLPA